MQAKNRLLSAIVQNNILTWSTDQQILIASEVMEAETGTVAETHEIAEAVHAGPGAAGAGVEGAGVRLRRDAAMLVCYLLDSEVHTFAFSFAANAILSFIPLIVMLYTIAGSVFHSPVMRAEVAELIKYLLPSNQDFVAQNLAFVADRHTVQLVSMLMILVACTGIFLPLEVALNRAWGVVKSRNYILNQVVALGLAAIMVMLGVLCVVLNAAEHIVLTVIFFGHIDNFVFRALSASWLILTTSAASIVFFFSVYWLMPNRKVPIRPVLRTSVITGLIWVGAKFVFVAVLPRLDLKALYGPFYISVGLRLWAYISGLLLFAGAQLSAVRWSAASSAPAVVHAPQSVAE